MKPYRSPKTRRVAKLVACCALTFCGLLPGCSGTDRPATVKVSGTITFAGKPPEFAGALFFAPLTVEEGYPRRGGRALFDTDGGFAVTSFEDGDGLVPGTYKVRIESWKQPPSMGQAGVSYVPRNFEPENLVVSPDESRIQYDLDVTGSPTP